MATNQDFRVKKGLVVSTTGTILSTVNAVSTVTGALQVAGGIGVGQDLWVGRNVTVIGTINASVQGVTTTATNLQSGTAGQIPYQVSTGNTGFFGPGSAGQVLVSDGVNAPRYQSTLTLVSTIQAISTNTGALQVQGGVGIGSNLYVGGNTTFVGITTVSNTTGVVGPTSGAFQVLGGAGINGGLNVGGAVTATSITIVENGAGNQYVLTMKGSGSGDQWAFTVGSTSGQNNITSLNSTGTVYAPFTVNGSSFTIGTIGASATTSVSINNSGVVSVVTNTASTSTTTGAVVITGGLGVGGSIYAGNIYSNGVLVGGASTTASNSTNLLGGQAGQVPYQLAPGVTTLTNAILYTGTFLTVNSNTVLTTASIIGQVGISVASTGTSSVYIAFIPGAQGLTADFGLISDPVGQNYFDFGSF
jgi:hypothetical protein